LSRLVEQRKRRVEAAANGKRLGRNGNWWNAAEASAFDFVTCRADWHAPSRIVGNELSNNANKWNLSCPLVTID
jgi:hypothetical protein